METFPLIGDGIKVTCLYQRPPAATALLVLGHGAGAGMRHAFMEALAAGLTDANLAVLRYQFPYTEAGKHRPDPEPVLLSTIRLALLAAKERAPELPLFAGGKSMGGRMTSRALATEPDEQVRGVVFYGFPLHLAKRPATARAAPLQKVAQPLLFLQGTRDALAELPLIEGVTAGLGKQATLHIVDGADHGFAVLKRSGRTDAEVLAELAAETARFCAAHAR